VEAALMIGVDAMLAIVNSRWAAARLLKEAPWLRSGAGHAAPVT